MKVTLDRIRTHTPKLIVVLVFEEHPRVDECTDSDSFVLYPEYFRMILSTVETGLVYYSVVWYNLGGCICMSPHLLFTDCAIVM